MKTLKTIFALLLVCSHLGMTVYAEEDLKPETETDTEEQESVETGAVNETVEETDQYTPETYDSDGGKEIVIDTEQIVITLDANGGTFTLQTDDLEGEAGLSTSKENRICVIKGKPLDYSNNIPEIENGKIFYGWTKDKNDSSNIVYDLSTLSFQEDTTLYAYYGEPITVTFHGIAEDGTTQAENSYNAAKGIPLKYNFDTRSNAIGTFVREEFEWKAQDCFTEKNLTGSVEILKYCPQKNTDFYYRMSDESRDTFNTVYFDANGGIFTEYFTKEEVISEEIKSFTYEKEKTKIDNPYRPSQERKVFVGWALKPNAGKNEIIDFNTYDVTPEETFYAVWDSAANGYKISFHASGSWFYKNGEDNLEIYVYPGNAIGYDGEYDRQYEFGWDGWNTKEDGSGEQIDDLTDYVPKGSMDLYARYLPGPIIDLTFDANGGTINAIVYEENDSFGPKREQLTSATHAYVGGVRLGKIINMSALSDIIQSASSKTLAGLSTVKDDSSTKVDGSFVLDKEMTLYALWEKAEDTLSFNIKSFDETIPSVASFTTGMSYKEIRAAFLKGTAKEADTEVESHSGSTVMNDTLEVTGVDTDNNVLAFYKKGYVIKIVEVNDPNEEIDVEMRMLGDVQNDNTINVADIVSIRNNILGTKKLSGENYYSADIDYDDVVNVADIVFVRNRILGTVNMYYEKK